ncbi:restriction endonuclease subunit S [uncultured Marivita sp.]|uniref:restriction endonuclease subunit S n=1 Tax=uncultured Marivita sp. TaxID=888080 RepID=UPI00260583A1|nr:restriction endonuclease subunit S [uncultured Marivita sp.]
MITLQERVHAAPKPDDWQLDKMHQVFRVRRGHKNAGMKEDNLLSLSYGRIIQKDIDTADGLLPENFEGYQIVEPGNIVLRLTDLQNDKRSLRQGLVTQRGIITSAYDAVEVQRDNDPRFWFYSLLALDLAKHYYSLGGGVRQSVKFADFPNDWVYRPDLATQRQIADFLDRETARLDLLIEKKQRFASGVEDEFLDRVSHLVTLGANEGTPRKQSGYAWHPTVPVNWTVTRLKFLCSRIVDCLHETPEHLEDGEYPSIRTSDLTRGSVDIGSAKRVSADEYQHRIQRLEPKEDDILYTREGERFGLAAMVPPETKLCLGQRMMMFRTNGRVLPAYLMWSLNGKFAYNFLKQDVTGATSPHLNIFDIRNVPVFLPPIDEQSALVTEIDAFFEKKSQLVEKTLATMDRLKEYRSALITSAVTGQIDVTTYAKSGTPDRRLDAIQEEMGA